MLSAKAKFHKRVAEKVNIMSRCTLEWIIFIVAMIVFLGFALSGRWNDLGIALVITGVLWYTLVPEYHSGRQ